jgi:hypothetical protein
MIFPSQNDKQIIEDYKSAIFHPGFAVFYCKELDKHAVRRLPLDSAEKDLVISEFQKNKVPPDGYAISIKSSGTVIKRTLIERVSDTTATSTINVSVPL